jgi:hypothetical protein
MPAVPLLISYHIIVEVSHQKNILVPNEFKVKHIFIKFIVNIVKHTILYQHLEMFLQIDENYNSILEYNIEFYLYTNNK